MYRQIIYCYCYFLASNFVTCAVERVQRTLQFSIWLSLRGDHAVGHCRLVGRLAMISLPLPIHCVE